MAEVVLSNPSRKVPKRRKRSRGDILKYWESRYGYFLKVGFTDAEAKWGADHGLSRKNSQVKDVARHRKASISFYMKDYGYTRMKAIELSAEDLENTLQNLGIKEKNLFYEVSP